jgi:hypothetical protein
MSGVSYAAVPEESNDLRRIGTITMLYGEPDEVYERALQSHKRHCRRKGYPMHVLSQNVFGSFWNKQYYLLSVVMQELAKRPSERVHWFMYNSSIFAVLRSRWYDGDTIVLNPRIPVEIFLPPADLVTSILSAPGTMAV